MEKKFVHHLRRLTDVGLEMERREKNLGNKKKKATRNKKGGEKKARGGKGQNRKVGFSRHPKVSRTSSLLLSSSSSSIYKMSRRLSLLIWKKEKERQKEA